MGETLAAVDAAGAAFRTRGWKMEVMVCDNNSTDRTAAIAEAAGARVVFEAENQISRSRNAAGNAARGDWIIFLDADSTPCEGLFAATADLMETESTLGGGVVIRMEAMPWWARDWPGDLELDQPRVSVAGGLVYFLPRGSVSGIGRLQPQTLCGGGN